jgi:hypothetical protein
MAEQCSDGRSTACGSTSCSTLCKGFTGKGLRTRHRPTATAIDTRYTTTVAASWISMPGPRSCRPWPVRADPSVSPSLAAHVSASLSLPADHGFRCVASGRRVDDGGVETSGANSKSSRPILCSRRKPPRHNANPKAPPFSVSPNVSRAKPSWKPPPWSNLKRVHLSAFAHPFRFQPC